MSPLSREEWLKQVESQPRIPDLINGLIPGGPGYSLVAGTSGIGKTNLSLNMAHSMATGSGFMSFSVGRPVKVAYLLFEGSKQNIADRIRKLEQSYPKKDLDENFWIDKWPSTYVTHPDRRREILEFAKGADVLFLDPLKNLIAKDPSKTETAHQLLEWLKVMYDDLGIHFVINHHVNKIESEMLYTSAAGDLNAIKGSTEYGDSAETVITMRRFQARGGGKFGATVPDRAILKYAKVRSQEDESLDEETIAFDRRTLMWSNIIL